MGESTANNLHVDWNTLEAEDPDHTFLNMPHIEAIHDITPSELRQATGVSHRT
jgi:hypothetical protein